MMERNGRDGMVMALEPISLIPFMEFEDFEFFGKMRFIIELKKVKLILILKPCLQSFTKSKGLGCLSD
jgi:hypothetical protein